MTYGFLLDSTFCSDLDKFAAEDIMDPIAKAKMVALKGIKKVMAQGSIGVAPGMSRQQVSLLAQRLSGASASSEMQNHVLPGSGGQERSNDPTQARPNPPTFAQGVINEADQRQYEEWLFHTQQLLQMQLKVLEEQIGVHRKSRKALCAKQRTAKKAGREFPEADAEKLKLVTEQQSKIQKQLDQVRKQQKEHTNLMTEYRNKQQQHQQQTSTVLALSPSQSPRLMAKLPGQLLSAHGLQQGPQGLAGQGGGLRLPQATTMAVQQGLSFMGQQPQQQPPQQQPPGGANAATFFSSNRLLQERQLQQQRLQLAQKLQQQNLLGQVAMQPQQQQQQSLMGQMAMQQQGLMGQVSVQQQQQQQQQQQSLMGQVAVQHQHQQQGLMGQVSMQQQPNAISQAGLMGQPPPPPPTPQPTQNLLPKQQGLLNSPPGVLVQQLSPQQQQQQQQQQQAMLGHPMLQHPGVMGHQASQRQMLLAPQQQHRALGSPQQLAQQAQGMMGHRLLLSQQQQQQQGLLGQQRALLSQQQQSSIAQHQALLGPGQAAQQGSLGPGQAPQPGLLGQATPPGALGQGPSLATEPIQHFAQHGSLNQTLHLSQGMQPGPSQPGLVVKEQQGGPEAAAMPPQEGADNMSQQGLRPHLVGPELGGQLQLGTQEQQGIAGLGAPLQDQPSSQLMLQQHGEHQKTPAEMGQAQQHLLLGSQGSLQLRMQQQQQSSLLQQPLRTHLPMEGSLQQDASQQQQQQQHRDATQAPHLPNQQVDPQSQVQNIMAQQQRIVGQNLEPPPKGLPGQLPPQQPQLHHHHHHLHLQSPAGPSKTPGLMVPQQPQQSIMVQQALPQGQSILSSPVMGQIRAQLQGVISKNPQLRNLTPQQQQQLQALLMQRHQQNLLQQQQSQALRQAGPYQGQGHVSTEPTQPAAQHPSLPGAVAQPPQRQSPLAVFQVRPEQSFPATMEQQRHPSPSDPKRPSPVILAKSPEQQLTPTEKKQPATPGSLLPPEPAPSTPEIVTGACNLRESECPTKDSVEQGTVNGQAAGSASPPIERAPAPTGSFQPVTIKQEPKEEAAQCALMSSAQLVKCEANGDLVSAAATVPATTNSLARSEAGHLLLQKLLRAKNVTLATQRSGDVNGHVDGKVAGVEGRLQAVPDVRAVSIHGKDRVWVWFCC
uniref:Uncharacterized protein n=1 Tax=Sphaerodactylus townsendi TaxID=933632 RepID=A0ACB8ENA1_9SAUR